MALMKDGSSPNRLRPIAARTYPRDAEGLMAQLSDPDSTARRWAARDLAAFPEAATALCARLALEADAAVRAVLFTSATQLGGPVVVRAMVQLLRSEDPALRNGAIEALAQLPDAVAPHIGQLLQDADSDVRIFTVNLLGDLRHPEVPRWLAQVLLREAEANVVGAALEVLAEVGGVEALPALHAVRQRFADQPFIGFGVDLALARIETP